MTYTMVAISLSATRLPAIVHGLLYGRLARVNASSRWRLVFLPLQIASGLVSTCTTMGEKERLISSANILADCLYNTQDNLYTAQLHCSLIGSCGYTQDILYRKTGHRISGRKGPGYQAKDILCNHNYLNKISCAVLEDLPVFYVGMIAIDMHVLY